jgi:tripartite-type tricarboxylate transporter receptor subunit TctC
LARSATAVKDVSKTIPLGKLNTEINTGLADPRLKARFADLGGTGLPGSPADFGKLIADDTEKWGKVVKLSGAKPE